MISCVFDTESGLVYNTGISLDKQPRIIEFYGCLVDDEGQILKELGFLCNPEMPIEKEVIKITGITDAMVKNQPPFRAFIEPLKDLFSGADAAVGHNISHDKAVVGIELERIGVDPATFWPKRMICTVEQTESIYGYRLRLSDLYQYLFNEGFTGAHRAREDARATARTFIELCKRGII